MPTTLPMPRRSGAGQPLARGLVAPHIRDFVVVLAFSMAGLLLVIWLAPPSPVVNTTAPLTHADRTTGASLRFTR